MIVVSDTTAIQYLVRIGYVGLLEDLYGQVYVPGRVVEEMLHPGAPIEVRAWVSAPPRWLVIREVSSPPAAPRLDPGERDAIALCLELRADRLLTDDRKAREVAENLGFRVVGTLAILAAAASRGGLDYDATVGRLLELGFRVSRETLERVRPK